MRFIGSGEDACLVAGGSDAPDVVSRRGAVASLLKGYQLYGWRQLDRGWRGCIADALKALHPEAAAHFFEHEDAAETRRLFCGEDDD